MQCFLIEVEAQELYVEFSAIINKISWILVLSQGSFRRIECSHKEVFLDLSVSVDIDNRYHQKTYFLARCCVSILAWRLNCAAMCFKCATARIVHCRAYKKRGPKLPAPMPLSSSSIPPAYK